MKKLLYRTLILLTLLLMSGCGDTTKQQAGNRTSIKAVIKPSALTAEQNVAGINLSITIPEGVYPALKPDGTVDGAATVEIISSAAQEQSLPGASYTPATGSTPGKLAISAIVAAGFKATDEITIHLGVAVGSFPAAEDFRLISFEAFDTNGARVTGLNPILTTTIQ